MKITIENIPHSKQRYDTVGDWYKDKKGDLHIKVSNFDDWRYSALIAIHELIEVVLCQSEHITAEIVDAWDRAHPDAGDNPAAPYHRQHIFAEALERIVALELGVRWDIYDAALTHRQEYPNS